MDEPGGLPAPVPVEDRVATLEAAVRDLRQRLEIMEAFVSDRLGY